VTANDSSRVRRKRSGELWSTIYKVVHLSLDLHKMTFFDRLYFGPKGVLATEIFTALDFDKVLLAHTTNQVRGSPENFKGEHLKLGLQFHIGAPITLGVVGLPHETLPWDVARGRGDQVDTNFTRGAPYKIWEGKKCPKFGVIFDSLRF